MVLNKQELININGGCLRYIFTIGLKKIVMKLNKAIMAFFS